MKTRKPRARAYDPDPAAPAGQPCEMPGCFEPGGYRAPKSREDLREYWWFCLDHVRHYNAGWDFYRGMTPGQIEAQIRSDIIGHRPTWPLGSLGGPVLEDERLLDPLGLLSGGKLGRKRGEPTNQPPPELREALSHLQLGWPLTIEELKSRYKQLAKKWHPDANGGDRENEDRFKTISAAYATLRRKLTRGTPLRA
jgi:hypothetical protein